MYMPGLQKEGYDTIDDIKDMTIAELVSDIKMKKGHAKRLLKRVREIYTASGVSD
jgi:hypothetical protein